MDIIKEDVEINSKDDKKNRVDSTIKTLNFAVN